VSACKTAFHQSESFTTKAFGAVSGNRIAKTPKQGKTDTVVGQAIL